MCSSNTLSYIKIIKLKQNIQYYKLNVCIYSVQIQTSHLNKTISKCISNRIQVIKYATFSSNYISFGDNYVGFEEKNTCFRCLFAGLSVSIDLNRLILLNYSSFSFIF